MRIIDKKHDFYDYLSNPEDTLVFDRRESYIVSKSDIYNKLDLIRYDKNSNYRFVVLQCGATYWLLLVTITNRDYFNGNYDIELLTTWKNFNKKRELLKLELISFINYFLYDKNNKIDYNKIFENVDKIKNMIDTNDYISEYVLCDSIHQHYNYKTRETDFTFQPPILIDTGIGKVIDPMQMFLAIEEHFSLLKTESERTDPIGATNDDKITSHGFDTKTSFRGKP